MSKKNPQHKDLAQELVPFIQKALEENQKDQVLELIKGLHATDVAKLIQFLRGTLRGHFIHFVRNQFDPEVLTRLDETVREEVIALLKPAELAAALSRLESNDAFLVIKDLDPEQKLAILDSIPPEERALLESVFLYPPFSAGRLMQREVVIIPSVWNVAQALENLAKNNTLPEVFYDLFVVDQKNNPLGVLPVSKLLKSDHNVLVCNIMSTNMRTISVTLDQEDVALLFRQYSLVSAPVIDSTGAVVGVITVDDVVDVIDEEAKEDIMHLAGVSDSDFYAPALSTSLARIYGLTITVLNTLIASLVIAQFQSALEKKVALGILMPIVASMGGNAGMQVVTVTVRALATRELRTVNMLHSILKEFTVAILNGTVFSILLGTIAASWFNDVALGLVLGCAVIFNMLWSGLAGTVLPILIARLGQDPALSAGPLVTTTTDVIGFSIFLWLSALFLIS